MNRRARMSNLICRLSAMTSRLTRKHSKLPDDMSPRDFLRANQFSPERVVARYPNARRLTLGGLFVSHSGLDTERIRNEIVSPVVFTRLPADGYFMHSRNSGGAEGYRELVQAALHWCDKFMVVISERSVANVWVQAEVEWALERARPTLVARLDSQTWQDLVRCLKLPPHAYSHQLVGLFDFSSDVERAQQKLAEALDELLVKLPRRGLV